MKTKIRLSNTFMLASTVCIALFAPTRGQAQTFPPIGYDTGPGIILTIDANGFTNVTSTGQGPYDNIEDTYIGIVNNSATPICSIRLQSPLDIFGFDGDGPCGIDPNTGQPFSPSPCSPTTAFGSTGYEGQVFNASNQQVGVVSFSSISFDSTSGTVQFDGIPPFASGIPPGGWAYFALEEAIQVTCPAITGIAHLPQGCGPVANAACPSPTPPSSCLAAAWACTPYARYASYVPPPGQPPKTIGKFGCHLTALTMLINYYAGTSKTPADLNAYLNTQPDGWTGDLGGQPCSVNHACNGPNYAAVARYAGTLGVQLSYTNFLPFKEPTACPPGAGGASNDFVVNSYLCSGNPVIMAVEGNSHFVLAYGEAQDEYLIDDPGNSTCHDLSCYNSSYNGIFAFSTTLTPLQTLLIVGHSPIEMSLSDPSGNRLGLDPFSAESFDDIADASYYPEIISDNDDPSSVESEVKVLQLPVPTDGTYTLDVFGTGTGTFAIDFAGYDSSGALSSQSINGMAIMGSVAEFQVDYSSAPGSQISATAVSPVTLGNISTRGFVQTGDNVMIGGLIVAGTGPKTVIVRAIGPELGAPPYNVPSALANPTLELHDATGALIASNDNWQTTIIGGIITSDQVADIRNSGYAPTDGRESAIIATLQPGNYTAIVRGVNNTTGVGLVEVYDHDLSPAPSSILGNISTRSFVQTGDNVMIGGFIVTGTAPKMVIVRAIGPELGAPPYNVPNALADPTLELHDSTGALIASNDNWRETIIGGIITAPQWPEIANSGYAPGDLSESAIIADLAPGSYTAIVHGVNNTTGVALVEVYDLQSASARISSSISTVLATIAKPFMAGSK